MSELFLIPARGGSRGIPGKNIAILDGRPLIYYTLDVALAVAPKANICVTTDSDAIIKAVKEYGLDIPFKRPENLATDASSTYDVILHAIDFYEKRQSFFDTVVLLQPTSPFRKAIHVLDALKSYHSNLDMVASVKKTKSNPYFTLFEENNEGFISLSKKGNFTRRQDCPKVYELNGAIYIMNVKSLKKHPPSKFLKVKKYLMSEEDSLDIDTPLDFFIAQTILSDKNKK